MYHEPKAMPDDLILYAAGAVSEDPRSAIWPGFEQLSREHHWGTQSLFAGFESGERQGPDEWDITFNLGLDYLMTDKEHWAQDLNVFLRHVNRVALEQRTVFFLTIISSSNGSQYLVVGQLRGEDFDVAAMSKKIYEFGAKGPSGGPLCKSPEEFIAFLEKNAAEADDRPNFVPADVSAENALTIAHQDGNQTLRLTTGGYCVADRRIAISIETENADPEGWPPCALFCIYDSLLDRDLQVGDVFEGHGGMDADDTVAEGTTKAHAYFSFHAERVNVKWTVLEVREEDIVFRLEARHDDVEYYDERAKECPTTGSFALSAKRKDELWVPS